MKKITQTVCALAACVLLIPGCAAAGEGDREAEQASSLTAQTEAAAHDDGTETVPAGIETENETETEMETETEETGAVDPSHYSDASSLPADEVEQYAGTVKRLILDGEWEAVADEMRYPAMVDGQTVDSREEFLGLGLESGLNPYFFVELEEETCHEMFCTYDGIMMGKTGRVWLLQTPEDGALKIRSINGLKEDFGLPGQVCITGSQEDITPVSMTVLLQNDTDLRVVFGDDYKLMKAGTGGAGVEELTPIAETGHNDIAYMPTRGEPVTLTVNWENRYGALEPGSYGLIKTVRDLDAEPGTGECERGFWFVIEGEE